MSSRSLNNDSVQYPTLSDTLSTSVEILNSNVVMNSNAQDSMNNVSGKNANNNAGNTFNNVASESFNTTANQEFNQISAIMQQTRLSEQEVKVTLESLDSIEELS